MADYVIHLKKWNIIAAVILTLIIAYPVYAVIKIHGIQISPSSPSFQLYIPTILPVAILLIKVLTYSFSNQTKRTMGIFSWGAAAIFFTAFSGYFIFTMNFDQIEKTMLLWSMVIIAAIAYCWFEFYRALANNIPKG